MMLTTLFYILLIGVTNAVPTEPPPPPPCPITYSITSNTTVKGPGGVAGITCTAGPDPCTIGATESYSVAVSITVGASLSLDIDDITAGLDTSVTYTTTSGTANTGTAECPAPYTCGLVVTPSYLQVSGVKSIDGTDGCEPPETGTGDYTVKLPIVVNNIPAINVQACTCPDTPNSSVPGGPVLCPTTCP